VGSRLYGRNASYVKNKWSLVMLLFRLGDNIPLVHQILGFYAFKRLKVKVVRSQYSSISNEQQKITSVFVC